MFFFCPSVACAQLVVLPSCGHVPQEEQPEEFLRLVLGELRGAGEWTVVEDDRVVIDDLEQRPPPA